MLKRAVVMSVVVAALCYAAERAYQRAVAQGELRKRAPIIVGGVRGRG